MHSSLHKPFLLKEVSQKKFCKRRRFHLIKVNQTIFNTNCTTHRTHQGTKSSPHLTNWLLALLTLSPSPHTAMESPHEHQQALLLSRIITNIEKLNEAVMMMNKSLQVCP